MSSHREAPEISKDPVADNTDVYAFVSPDDQSTVTFVANFVPLQGPDGGPNFFAFGKDVLYEIHIFNKAPITAVPNITYQFRFTETYLKPDSFLYNLGTVTVDPNGSGETTYKNLNRRQTYSVSKVVNGGAPVQLATGIPVPPCNVGVHSTPNYPSLVPPAIKKLNSGETVFCGQRAEGFFADLGAIFDLADLRPLQFLHTGPLGPQFAVDSLRGLNINSIVLKVPKTALTADGKNPTDVMSPNSVIGVYSSASRTQSTVYNADGSRTSAGAPQQVSRLGNPLFNEVLIGIGQKDLFNAEKPVTDASRVGRVSNPELAQALPNLYPNTFNNLKTYNANNPNRTDLVAILLTGIPATVVPNFQNNTGTVLADLLRLNMAVPVTAKPNDLGVIGGDLQGFPNGRRLTDDIADIELKAIAGATLPLVNKAYQVDVAVNLVADYATQDNGPFLPNFPYLGTPNSGFATLPKNYDTGN